MTSTNAAQTPLQTTALQTTAQCEVDARACRELREVLRTAVPRSDTTSDPTDVAVASPIQPFVIAWRTFDTAVATVTGLDRPIVFHLHQAIRQERPVEPGEHITLDLAIAAIRPEPRGARMCFASSLMDHRGRRIAELTTDLLALDAEVTSARGQFARPAAPADPRWDTSVTVTLPGDLPSRYADASADRNPIHLDDAVARDAGLDGVVVHGMSVVGVVSELACDRFADGDAGLIRGVGVRFSSPVTPERPVDVEFTDPDETGRVWFRCRTDERLALKNGWIDVAR